MGVVSAVSRLRHRAPVLLNEQEFLTEGPFCGPPSPWRYRSIARKLWSKTNCPIFSLRDPEPPTRVYAASGSGYKIGPGRVRSFESKSFGHHMTRRASLLTIPAKL